MSDLTATERYVRRCPSMYAKIGVSQPTVMMCPSCLPASVAMPKDAVAVVCSVHAAPLIESAIFRSGGNRYSFTPVDHRIKRDG